MNKQDTLIRKILKKIIPASWVMPIKNIIEMIINPVYRAVRWVRVTPVRVLASVIFGKASKGKRKGWAFLPFCTFSGDGFATTHNVSFLKDHRFAAAFESAFSDIPDIYAIPFRESLEWRAHICVWAANKAMQVDGDFVECGVWYGVLSKIICNYMDFGEKDKGKRFYLVDTWGKMPGGHQAPYYQEDIFHIVQKRFANHQYVDLVRGVVPDVLPLIPVEKVAYLAIDMNGHLAERAALEFFYDKLSSGAVVYLDDYGWDYPELRKTVDDFLNDKPETLLHFPSGNSIFIKV